MSMTAGSEITLEYLKGIWNQVLDQLLDQDRIAWLAFFDARLVSLAEGTLTLSFADVTKLSGDHNFSLARNPRHIALLQGAIREITGADLEISEE